MPPRRTLPQLSSERRSAARLPELLEARRCVRVLGTTDGLVARLAERCGFDALWASGFGISAMHGLPDAGILTMTEMLDAAAIIADSSSLPVIADCDTGFGDVSVVTRMVQTYERANVAAVCIEDKCFPKRNSFRNGQRLADAAEFAAKVEAAVRARRSSSFIVIARLESFIAGQGLDDALARGTLYAQAGADVVLVHSKASTPSEVNGFAERWRAAGLTTPLAVVPTTYPSLVLADLNPAIRMVIYANQALRASVMAMTDVLTRIVQAGTTSGIEQRISSMGDVFDLVDTQHVDDRDEWFARRVERWRTAHARQLVPVTTDIRADD